jgi:hypothetical protein
LRQNEIRLTNLSRTHTRQVAYRISNERYQLDGGVTGWQRWTWSGSAGCHVPSAFDCRGADPGAPASDAGASYRRDDLAWAPMSASRIDGGGSRPGTSAAFEDEQNADCARSRPTMQS